MPRHCKRSSHVGAAAIATLMVVVAMLASPTWAQQPDDPLARWRARIDDAKRQNIPAPPKGIRDTGWQELAPPDWDITHVMQQIRANGPAIDPNQSDTHDTQMQAMERAMQRAFDTAPTVAAYDDTPVRLTGLAVMLQPGQGLAKLILLVPYHGVGMDRRAPPANQMVLVAFKRGLPRNLEQTPIWVTGRIYSVANQTVHGRVGYMIPDGHWQKFPAKQFPLPRYRVPH